MLGRDPRLTCSGSERGRTSNPRFRRPVLYPLSYGSSIIHRTQTTNPNDKRRGRKRSGQGAEREGFEPSVQVNPIRRFSKPVPSATRPSLPGNLRSIPPNGSRMPSELHLRDTIRLSSQPAEEEGFEPPELALGGFQDRCLRPLGHSSRRSQRQGRSIGIVIRL